jgi:hypothetical protein
MCLFQRWAEILENELIKATLVNRLGGGGFVIEQRDKKIGLTKIIFSMKQKTTTKYCFDADETIHAAR